MPLSLIHGVGVALVFTLGAVIAQSQTETPLLKIGDQIPAFKLPYATKETVEMKGIGSADLTGQRYLLAFYPADFSSGCTKEMCTFRDQLASFEALKVTVLPVSADLVFAHHEFAKQQNLPFKLLADQTREFGTKMGVYMPEQGFMKRSVFVVGPTGKIEFINADYSVKDDTDLNALKGFLAKVK